MSNFCVDCEHYRIGICDARGIYPYPPDRISCDKFTQKAIKENCVAESRERVKESEVENE